MNNKMKEWTAQEDNFIAHKFRRLDDFDIAEALGRYEHEVRFRRLALGYDRNKFCRGPCADRMPDDPTPEEIVAKCAQIKSKWTNEERQRRSNEGPRQEYEVMRYQSKCHQGTPRIFTREDT